MGGAALPGLRLPEVDEVRALWLVRTALLDPNSARTAVRRADEAGFNTLLVQVRGRGDAYYRSRWEPRAETLAGQPADFDPLAVVLNEARRRGLAVHAWLNVHVVASARIPPRDPGHLALARPDLLAVPREIATELLALDPHDPRYLERLRSWTLRNEERVEGIYTNPAHPDIAAHLTRVIEDLLLEYPLDGLHLDYIRYPSAEFDYSRASLLAFHEFLRNGSTRRTDGIEEGRIAPVILPGEDPWEVATEHPERWDEFRRERVTATMEQLFRAARGVRPDLVISAAVFPEIGDARASRYQPWTEWLERGIVDAVAPMAYTESPERFRSQIEDAVDVVGGARVWAGLGLYRTSFEGAVEQARIARAAGAGGFALFSYDWAVGPEGTRAARGGYLLRFADALWRVF